MLIANEEHEFKVHHLFKFSAKKYQASIKTTLLTLLPSQNRMSILVENKKKQLFLFVKGNEDAMYDMINPEE